MGRRRASANPEIAVTLLTTMRHNGVRMVRGDVVMLSARDASDLVVTNRARYARSDMTATEPGANPETGQYSRRDMTAR